MAPINQRQVGWMAGICIAVTALFFILCAIMYHISMFDGSDCDKAQDVLGYPMWLTCAVIAFFFAIIGAVWAAASPSIVPGLFLIFGGFMAFLAFIFASVAWRCAGWSSIGGGFLLMFFAACCLCCAGPLIILCLPKRCSDPCSPSVEQCSSPRSPTCEMKCTPQPVQQCRSRARSPCSGGRSRSPCANRSRSPQVTCRDIEAYNMC